MNIFKASLSFLFIVLLSSLCWAGTPQIINYQGRLLDSAGQAIPDGIYEISFTIYNSLIDGALKWSETQPNISVNDGLFSAVMGSVQPLPDSVFNDENRYLEVSVADQILSPRTQFTSVGFAHRISTIDGARAGDLSGSLVLTPSDFSSEGNAVTIVNGSDQPVLGISVDATGNSTLSMYDPADSKADGLLSATTALDISVDPNGLGKISFYDPADSKSGIIGSAKSLEITVDPDGLGKISFYDPADSKFGLADSAVKKVEMHRGGIVMFGATEQDTSLYVAPNGDIIGLGQITMGENSSNGIQTSVLGFNNEASGDSSTIGGGSFNITTGAISVISGGHGNNASGTGVTISGGSFNEGFGNYATVGGGQNNTALGDYSTIPGGQYNSTEGIYSFAAGRRAKAVHDGSFVWADHTDEDFYSTKTDQFIIRANGGVGIGTNDPNGLLEISGFGGDSSIILPDDAIASPEIADEPGIAVDINPSEVLLNPNLQTMQDLITIEITIPADGYIIVRGDAILATTGTTGPNQAFMQIDETSGGVLNEPFYTLAGSGDHDSPNKEHYFSMNTERIYSKAGGTYQFRLEAMQNPDKGGGATAKIQRPHITAMYFPTSYGSIYSSNAGN